MADIRLFRVGKTSVTQLDGQHATVERTLQTLIETHLEALLGVRFLASEHRTGDRHGGRIDTLGLDGDQRPVIVEYKRHTHEGHFTQILDYLSWLEDHKGDFRWLTQAQLGVEAADSISWDSPRLLCVAGDFSDRARNAVRMMDAGIELIRYRHYGDDLLALERLNPADDASKRRPTPGTRSVAPRGDVAGAGDSEHLTDSGGGHDHKKPTPHKAAQLEFWQGFVQHMADHPTLRCQKPRGETYMNFAGGRSGFQFALFHSPLGQLTDNPGGELRIQVDIRGAHASGYYALLEAQREGIEREIGEEILWRPMPNHKACFVTIAAPCDAMDRTHWPAQHEWLRGRLELFDRVFRPRISELRLPTGGQQWPDGA